MTDELVTFDGGSLHTERRTPTNTYIVKMAIKLKYAIVELLVVTLNNDNYCYVPATQHTVGLMAGNIIGRAGAWVVDHS